MRYLPILLLAACGSDPVETIGGGGATPCGGPIASVLAAIASSSAEATASASSSSAGQGGGSSPSATSSGSGEGGAPACEVCDQETIARHGTRLAVIRWRSDDGALLPFGLYDTALEIECVVRERPSGPRCVPVVGEYDDDELVGVIVEAGTP